MDLGFNFFFKYRHIYWFALVCAHTFFYLFIFNIFLLFLILTLLLRVFCWQTYLDSFAYIPIGSICFFVCLPNLNVLRGIFFSTTLCIFTSMCYIFNVIVVPFFPFTLLHLLFSFIFL